LSAAPLFRLPLLLWLFLLPRLLPLRLRLGFFPPLALSRLPLRAPERLELPLALRLRLPLPFRFRKMEGEDRDLDLGGGLTEAALAGCFCSSRSVGLTSTWRPSRTCVP